MGCPYEADIIFGFKLTKSKAKEITNKIDKIESNFPENGDWDKEVGSFDSYIRSDDNETKFFLEITSVANASNCEYVVEVGENKFESAKKEAYSIYDTSPFLKENFKREDIKLLLTSRYVG
jgi:hypothetical protein